MQFPSFTFDVTEGDFKGRYEVNLGDYTATELGNAGAELGRDIEAVLAETARTESPPPLKTLAAFVWLTHRRRSQAKGLAFKKVTDSLRWDFIDFPDIEDEPEDVSPEA